MAETTVVTRRRRARFWILAFLWLVVVLVLAAAIGGYAFLRASLPTLDGEIAAAGLRGPVTVTRDVLGVPTIRGGDRGDVAFATGFVHAQERFFQMDLLRRAGAGDLAALLGKTLLPVDRERRIHRFGARAGVALAALPEPDRVLLERYTAGVNAGLSGLGARPFEYGVLRATPRPWVAQDTLLVVWAMYFDLQEEQLHRVFSRGWLRDQGTTVEQLAFLLPSASGYDAPLDAAAIDVAPAPLPAQAPAWFGKPAKTKVALLEDIGNDAAVGSNNWVVAGGRSKSGAAIVANDMHLTLRLPHIWYRAAFELESAGAPRRRLVGVTLPGTPALVAGSNGQVAWGLTNSYGAYLDLLELEFDPKDASRYRLPPTMRGASGDEWGLVRTVEERIAVAGDADEVLPVKETAFGPVWERGGRRYAVHWVAHDPGAINFVPFELERAATTAEAIAIAKRAGYPAQNLVAGDAAGRIGWTVAGALPAREASWASTFPAPASRPRRTPGARSPRRRRIRASATRRRGRSSPPTPASSPAPATRRSATAAPTSAPASASCATASPRSDPAPTRPACTAFSSTTAPSTSRPGATAPCKPLPATPTAPRAPSATSSSACSRPPGPAGRASIRSATG